MTTHILNFGYTTGQSLTAQLFELGSDTVAATASSVTEATNRKGRYAATFSDVAAGSYMMVYFIGGTAVGSEFYTSAADGESLLPWSEYLTPVNVTHFLGEPAQPADDVAKQETLLEVQAAVEAGGDLPQEGDVRAGVEYGGGLYVGVLDVGTGLPIPEYPPGSTGL